MHVERKRQKKRERVGKRKTKSKRGNYLKENKTAEILLNYYMPIKIYGRNFTTR